MKNILIAIDSKKGFGFLIDKASAFSTFFL